MKRKTNKKVIAFIATLVLVVSLCAPAPVIRASGLTYLKDTLSTLQNSSGGDVFADHEIMFTTADGVDSTQTIVITFPADFDGANDPQGAVDFNDVDFFVDSSPDQSCGDGTTQTLVASAPGNAEWSAVFSGTEGRVLTLTSGGASATVAAGYEVCIEIGENATGGAANSQYANPTTSGEKITTLTVGTTDTGSCPVYIVDDDSVAVSGSVLETLTFKVDDGLDCVVVFDTLYSTKVRYAGAAAGSDTVVIAHDLKVTTNASTGYNVTYNGITLTTPSSDTIDPLTSGITGDADGTIGMEQFGMSIAKSDNATIASGYAYTGPDYKFVAGAATQIISETVPTAEETFSVYYLANIHATTDAGTYSTSVTFIASGNF